MEDAAWAEQVERVLKKADESHERALSFFVPIELDEIVIETQCTRVWAVSFEGGESELISVRRQRPDSKSWLTSTPGWSCQFSGGEAEVVARAAAILNPNVSITSMVRQP